MEERIRGGYSDFKGKLVVREVAYRRWEVKVLCGEWERTVRPYGLGMVEAARQSRNIQSWAAS